jgi:hypothetical protein
LKNAVLATAGIPYVTTGITGFKFSTTNMKNLYDGAFIAETPYLEDYDNRDDTNNYYIDFVENLAKQNGFRRTDWSTEDL